MATHAIDLANVKKFWKWFSRNCNGFGDDFNNTKLLDKLDNWISKLGDFSWEIGPGKQKKNSLVISPNGDEELIEDTKEIVKNAIGCDGWEYYYAKPPKEWQLIFDFETVNGKLIEVNASAWEYSLLQYEDGMFEIIIKAPDLKGLNTIDKISVAEITLDGVIGEELRMKTICEIDVVEDFEMQYQNRSTHIKSLPDQLNRLIDQ